MTYTSRHDLNVQTIAGRPVVSTSQGGKAVLDRILLALLQEANGRTLPEVLSAFHRENATEATVAAGLACLVEGGLLVRDGAEDAGPLEVSARDRLAANGRVSAVIVAFNGKKWLPGCLDSLQKQLPDLEEILVVDNCSSDGTAQWLIQEYPDVKIIGLEKAVSFAAAVNQGIAAAGGDYFLILNQDIKLDLKAVECLIEAAAQPKVAAVASCLKFMQSPGFLNGIGNQARALGWGSDLLIGELDLGQFAGLRRVPSVCLATALIRRDAWQQVGPLDEGYPMYYEDTDWCYRARAMGYEIAAAPEAVSYHAFGGGGIAGNAEMDALRLENVTYGRLRFQSRLNRGWRRTARIGACLAQDLAGMAGSLLRLRADLAGARLRAWQKWFAQIPESILVDPDSGRHLNRQPGIHPYPRVWRGLPELTWESVCSHYLPLMIAGKTKVVPELAGITADRMKEYRLSGAARLRLLWQGEGVKAVLRHLWREARR